MSYYIGGVSYGDKYLAHYGVLGMKWGVRRYENPDGTLTEAGKKRYGEQGKYTYTSAYTKRLNRRAQRAEQKSQKAAARGDKYREEKYAIKADVRKGQAARSQEVDSRMEQYARSVSTGGNILSRMFTNVGSTPYVEMLAAHGGHDRLSAGKKFAAATLTGSVGLIGSAGAFRLGGVIGGLVGGTTGYKIGSTVGLAANYVVGRKIAGRAARSGYVHARDAELKRNATARAKERRG